MSIKSDESLILSPDFENLDISESLTILPDRIENDGFKFSVHRELIFNPMKIGSFSKGRIERRKGLFRYMYYYECENPNLTRNRLLKAVKTFKGFDIYRYEGNEEIKTAKIESNLFGTKYILKEKNTETLIIRYNMCLFKNKGPRSFLVIFGGLGDDNKDPLSVRWKKEHYSSLILLCNKKPLYNNESNSYVLNFNGRVTHPSVKNFQLIHPHDPTHIILTFGKIGQNSFILDYTHPWNAIQAFCIGLSALDYKIFCE